MGGRVFILFCICFFLEAQLASSKRQRNRSVVQQKRADDPQPLQAVVDQLAERLATVEAQNAGESGEVAFTPHDEPTVTFPNSNHVERSETHHVAFSTPFDKIPAVTFAFNFLDAEQSQNLRVNADILNLGTGGFDLKVLEWEASYNYGVHLSWMACPKA